MDLTTIIMPLFEVVPREWDALPPERYDAVVMTSANAARHGGAQLALYRHLPLYAVGAATADAARIAGFDNIVVGKGDASSIFAQARRDGQTSLLHLAGEDRIADADADTVTLYAAVESTNAVSAGPSVTLLHSSRAAKRFAALCPDKDVVDLVAISAAVAAAAGPGWRTVSIADIPNDRAMLALAARLCEEER